MYVIGSGDFYGLGLILLCGGSGVLSLALRCMLHFKEIWVTFPCKRAPSTRVKDPDSDKLRCFFSTAWDPVTNKFATKPVNKKERK